MSDDPIKDVLRRLRYGLYVLTSRNGEEVNAMTCNWLTQVSFTPRLLAVGLQKTSFTHGLVEQGQVFAVNVFLSSDAESVKRFTKGRAKNPDKMKDAAYHPAPLTGCPILDGAAAYLECKVVAVYDPGGDHSIVVGEVVGAGVEKPGEAADTLSLLDLGWNYSG